MSEAWKPVPAYEGFYEASTLGRIRSVNRSHWTTNPHTGKPMKRRLLGRVKKQHEDADGYLQVRLSKDGKTKTARVSRLVLGTFVGDGEEACHLDHDKRNNALSNLRWGTRAENESQKTEAGRRPLSTVKGLTPEQAEEIRQLRSAKKLTYKQLAELFGVHLSTIGLVVTRKTWSGA